MYYLRSSTTENSWLFISTSRLYFLCYCEGVCTLLFCSNTRTVKMMSFLLKQYLLNEVHTTRFWLGFLGQYAWTVQKPTSYSQWEQPLTSPLTELTVAAQDVSGHLCELLSEERQVGLNDVHSLSHCHCGLDTTDNSLMSIPTYLAHKTVYYKKKKRLQKEVVLTKLSAMYSSSPLMRSSAADCRGDSVLVLLVQMSKSRDPFNKKEDRLDKCC